MLEDIVKNTTHVEKFHGFCYEDFEIRAMQLMPMLESRDYAHVVNEEENLLLNTFRSPQMYRGCVRLS